MIELLDARGFGPDPVPGAIAPVFDAAGDRPNHKTKPAEYYAEMSLLLGGRFTHAWTAGEWARAAEYAFLCGSYQAKAYMHSRKTAQAVRGKKSRSDSAKLRDHALVAQAVAKCTEKRGNCTVKDLHNWLAPKISYKRYHAILNAGGFAPKRAEIREKFLAKR